MRAYHLSVVLLGATFAQLLAGGLVHATGSSLACPDWPLCYGQAFPAMHGGILFEHSHRLLGTAVGLLTFLLCVELMRHLPRGQRPTAYGALVLIVVQGVLMGLGVSQALRPPVAVALLGAAAFVPPVVWLGRHGAATPVLGLILLELVVIQGLLGGLTVVLRLPTAVSTVHLAISLLFLCLVLYAVLRLRPSTHCSGAAVTSRRGLACLLVGVYLQLLLGALVRHTGAGMACNTEILTCAGALLPSGGPAWLVFGHRLFAVVVAGMSAVTLLALQRRAALRDRPAASWLTSVALALVVLQVILGILTVKSFIAVAVATAHSGVGALLLTDLLALYLCLGPLGRRYDVAAPEPLATLAKAAG